MLHTFIATYILRHVHTYYINYISYIHTMFLHQMRPVAQDKYKMSNKNTFIVQLDITFFIKI